MSKEQENGFDVIYLLTLPRKYEAFFEVHGEECASALVISLNRSLLVDPTLRPGIEIDFNDTDDGVSFHVEATQELLQPSKEMLGGIIIGTIMTMEFVKVAKKAW